MKDPIKELQMKLHKVIYKPVKKSDIPQQIPPFIDYDTIIKDMLKKLFVYAGSEHKHQAQNPETLELKF